MINKNRFLAVCTAIAVTIALNSCVQDDDFKVPENIGTEENQGLENLLASGATEISIADLKSRFQGNNNQALLIDTDIYVKGFVSSSDRTSNFFKELFIQNAPENPTDGIKLIINQVDTYNQFNLGREIYIKLNGLYIGEERVGNGLITIGGAAVTDQYGTSVKRLTESQRTKHIFRSTTTAALVPLQLTFSQVKLNHIGMYVTFSNVEFADHLPGKPYFDPNEDFDTLRKLQSCEGTIGYSNFTLEVSSFASFKDQLLPTGNGTITGTISKTFDGSAVVLGINETTDVNMIGERCTPLNTEDFTVAFKEDFEKASNNSIMDFEGWTNYNEAGKNKWREKVFDGNGLVEFSSFKSGDVSNIAWLITPGFAVTSQSKYFLNFKAAQHNLASPKNTLEVLVSTDFDGSNVLNATWTLLEAALPTQLNVWYEFVDSGLIDLTSYSGTVHVAFKVSGSGADSTLSGAFQIDDVTILATN